LKRGHYVVLGGVALLAIGIIMGAVVVFQLLNWSSKDNVFVEDWPLGVGQSKTLSLQVTNMTKHLNTLVIAVDQVELHEVVTDPGGKAVVDLAFAKAKNTDFDPTLPGTYTLVITNNGSSPTSITAALRQPQVVPQGEPEENFDYEVGILIGGVFMVITGVIVTIIGGVLIVIDRKKQHAAQDL
jgi:hypothetical protein